mgnify:CR=1 FL=1
MIFFSRSFDRFLTVVVPLVVLGVVAFLEMAKIVSCVSACEDGPIENIQALITFAAFCLGVSLLRIKNPAWVRAFFAIGTFAALYITLEEIRYGQGLFGWGTPEFWAMVNDQNETNLHNTSSWFDQKPRLLLEIGVVVGGIVIPAIKKWAPQRLPEKFSIVYPTSALTLTACFAIGGHLYSSVLGTMGRQDLFVFDRNSEMEEVFLYWFIFLYFLFKRRELTSKESAR